MAPAGIGRSDWGKKFVSNRWLSRTASSSRTTASFRALPYCGVKLHSRPSFSHRHKNSTGISRAFRLMRGQSSVSHRAIASSSRSRGWSAEPTCSAQHSSQKRRRGRVPGHFAPEQPDECLSDPANTSVGTSRVKKQVQPQFDAGIPGPEASPTVPGERRTQIFSPKPPYIALRFRTGCNTRIARHAVMPPK